MDKKASKAITKLRNQQEIRKAIGDLRDQIAYEKESYRLSGEVRKSSRGKGGTG